MADLGKDIDHAEQLLHEGRLVAIPTETVYGLAGNGLSTTAVSKIYRVKNRPFFDPMIIHTDSLEKLEGLITKIPDGMRQLAETFWPGPLTILVEKTEKIPDLVTSGLSKVAIRIPNHPLTLELLKRLEFPLAAPSANPFGYISPTTAKHVEDQLGDMIPYILDGGKCAVGLESTIIDFIDGEPTILRKGGIPIELIEKELGVNVKSKTSSSRPSAPGMLHSHYAPKAPLVLEKIENVLLKISPEKIGFLGFTKKHLEIPSKNQFILSSQGDLTEAAQNFFDFLRKLDRQNLSVIVAEFLPEVGLGRAINDKLRRAAISFENFEMS